jgi:hypothetical protein
MVRALLRAMAKDPADRWPSAGAFAAALAQGVPAVPSGAASPAPTTLLPGAEARPASGSTTARLPGARSTPTERLRTGRSADATALVTPEAGSRPAPRRGSFLPWLGLLVAVGLVGLVAVRLLPRQTPEVARATPLPTPEVRPVAAPATAAPATLSPQPTTAAPSPTPEPVRSRVTPAPARREGPPAAPTPRPPAAELPPPSREEAHPPSLTATTPAIITGPVAGTSSGPVVPAASSSGPDVSAARPATPTSAKPARYVFQLDTPIALADPGPGPVTLRAVQLHKSGGDLVAEVELSTTADCNVAVTVEVLDEAGWRLLTLAGRKRVRGGKTEIVEAEQRANEAVILGATFVRVQTQAY